MKSLKTLREYSGELHALDKFRDRLDEDTRDLLDNGLQIVSGRIACCPQEGEEDSTLARLNGIIAGLSDSLRKFSLTDSTLDIQVN